MSALTDRTDEPVTVESLSTVPQAAADAGTPRIVVPAFNLTVVEGLGAGDHPPPGRPRCTT